MFGHPSFCINICLRNLCNFVIHNEITQLDWLNGFGLRQDRGHNQFLPSGIDSLLSGAVVGVMGLCLVYLMLPTVGANSWATARACWVGGGLRRFLSKVWT